MGTKDTPGKYDCYAKAEPGEPMFVLLGRDPSAALLVRLWALIRHRQNEQCGNGDLEQIDEALRCAQDMQHWHLNHGRRAALPDGLPEKLFIPITEGMMEHPEGFDWPCDCDLCRSYA